MVFVGPKRHLVNVNRPVALQGNNVAWNAVKAAVDYMLSNGVKRVVPLAVSGAFHSKYMKDAGEKFEEYVKNIQLNDANISVITNVDAEITMNAEDFREKMPKQIYSSVHWSQTESINRVISWPDIRLNMTERTGE